MFTPRYGKVRGSVRSNGEKPPVHRSSRRDASLDEPWQNEIRYLAEILEEQKMSLCTKNIEEQYHAAPGCYDQDLQ